jgi:hypothetical protein
VAQDVDDWRVRIAETRSTWLWSEFRVAVPGTVLSIWITGQLKHVDLR